MKYVFLFLAAFTLLALTEGCAVLKFVNDPVKGVKEAIWGKPKPKPEVSREMWTEEMKSLTPEELSRRLEWCGLYSTPTAEQKVRKLFGIGATLGGAIAVISVLLLIFAKGMRKADLIKGILFGIVLIVVSVVFDKYLIPIVVVVIVLGALVAGWYIYRNWEKVKKMALMTDETIERGKLTHEQVHGAANKTIGLSGTPLREEIKADADRARKLQEA